MAAEPLTVRELEFTDVLKEANIIRPIRKVDRALQNGFVLCVCGDGNRTQEGIEYLKGMIRSTGSLLDPHLLCLNGGPLLVPEKSPLNAAGESAVLKKHIVESLEMKHLDTLLLKLHAPCGAAQSKNLSIEEYFIWFYQAYIEMELLLPNTRIVTQCHLHKPDGFGTYDVAMDRLSQANFMNNARTAAT